MLKNITYELLILIVFSISCFYIYESNNIISIDKKYKKATANIDKNVKSDIYEQDKDEKFIGILTIPKINIRELLYPINSKENQIDRHVTILNGSIDPNIDNSILFLAAHSGTGSIAYFNNINQLLPNDEIFLNYDNKDYVYIVKELWETNKDGDIEVPKLNTKQLILTTCSKHNKSKQLIINSTIKES